MPLTKEDCICTILLTPMQNATRTNCGHRFEAAAISQVVDRCPMCRSINMLPLTNDIEFQQQINAYMAANPQEFAEFRLTAEEERRIEEAQRNEIARQAHAEVQTLQQITQRIRALEINIHAGIHYGYQPDLEIMDMQDERAALMDEVDNIRRNIADRQTRANALTRQAAEQQARQAAEQQARQAAERQARQAAEQQPREELRLQATQERQARAQLFLRAAERQARQPAPAALVFAPVTTTRAAQEQPAKAELLGRAAEQQARGAEVANRQPITPQLQTIVIHQGAQAQQAHDAEAARKAKADAEAQQAHDAAAADLAARRAHNLRNM